ncbi:hypothetical protein L218DRAFT_1000691 [Marasmius fiardii PR-910]|nr:hypothetical protein L218DRAFT_1000691 [Marasmius fiardii PR-910]
MPGNIRELARHIPDEIQENIINRLLEDTGSNLNTSLVCKHWRTCVYRNAFSSIALHPHSISTFRSFLDSPFSSTPILSSIRHIDILGESPDWPPFSPEHITALTSILSHFATLRNISSLSLRAVSWDVLGTNLQSLLASVDSIRSLELTDVTFGNYGQCSEFLGRFRSLTQLVLKDLRFSSSSGWDPASHPPYESFSNYHEDDEECMGTANLTLRCQWGPSLQKALKWSGVLPYNCHLTLAQFGAQTRVDIDSSVLLRNLGPLLNTLEIVSTADVFGDLTMRSLDLSQNQRLSELKFISPDRVLGTISWLPALLASAPPSLRSIQIAFAASRQFNLDLPFLLRIVNILDPRRFQELRLVHFDIFSPRSDTDLDQTIKEQICSAFARSEWSRNRINRIEFTFR